MRIRGVLLGTLKEQIEGGDKNPIDPRLVKLDRVEDGLVPVTIGFQRDKVVGKTVRVWREDGRLMFEADIINKDFAKAVRQGAIGIAVDTAELAYDLEPKDAAGYTVKGGRIFEIGLTNENQNHNQPEWGVIPDGEPTDQ